MQQKISRRHYTDDFKAQIVALAVSIEPCQGGSAANPIGSRRELPGKARLDRETVMKGANGISFD